MKTERTGLIPSMLAPGERQRDRVLHGCGVELTLSTGEVVLDGGSLSSCIVGHCHPKVVEAVQRAASDVYVSDGNGYGPRDQAAEDLLGIAFADDPWADGVILTISSSEAGDLALMLAQMLTEREVLVCRERSYHGAVGFAREVSLHPLWSGALVAPMDSGPVLNSPRGLAHVRHLPVPDCGLGVIDPSHDCYDMCLADAHKLLEGSAAVIMDYSQGAVMPSAQYQDKLADAARRAGSLWIADETVTAFGRLGHLFAFHRGESRPDIVTLGKGITGGAAPAGAIVLSREVVESMGDRRWKTSSTFRGHPLAVAAISATMHVVAEEGLVTKAASLGKWAESQLRTMVSRHECVKAVIGEGLLWLVELAVPEQQAEGNWYGNAHSDTLPELVHQEALRRGAFIPVFSGQCVWLIPPLIIDQEDLGVIIEALDAALSVADRHVA